MIRALWNAASGMQAGRLRVDVAGHNVANVNTPGYRRVQADFADVLYQDMAGGRLEVGNGVRPLSLSRDLTPAVVEETGNPLDLAVFGQGFFVLRRPDGSRAYTRDGSFRLDSDGRITSTAGHYLEIDYLEGAPFRAEGAGSFSIREDGTVTWTGNDGEETPVGAILLALPVSTAAGRDPEMTALGGNLYVPPPDSEVRMVGPGSGEAGRIRQGFLERSNVILADEIVEMIVAQRAYQLSARAVQSADTMLALANNIRRS